MMHKMDNLNISDYYVSLEFLSAFPDNNIDKWIESGNSQKIKTKLSKLYKYGGSFSANHYQCTSTEPVQIPFLYKKNKNYFIEFTDTRLVHFFPKLSNILPNGPEVIPESFGDKLDKILNEIVKPKEASEPDIKIAEPDIKIAKPNNKRKLPKDKCEITPLNKKLKTNINTKQENVDLDSLQPEIPQLILNSSSKTKAKQKSVKFNESIQIGDNNNTTIMKSDETEMKQKCQIVAGEIPRTNNESYEKTDSSPKKKRSKSHSATEMGIQNESIDIDRFRLDEIAKVPDQLAIELNGGNNLKKNKKKSKIHSATEFGIQNESNDIDRFRLDEISPVTAADQLTEAPNENNMKKKKKKSKSHNRTEMGIQNESNDVNVIDRFRSDEIAPVPDQLAVQLNGGNNGKKKKKSKSHSGAELGIQNESNDIDRFRLDEIAPVPDRLAIALDENRVKKKKSKKCSLITPNELEIETKLQEPIKSKEIPTKEKKKETTRRTI